MKLFHAVTASSAVLALMLAAPAVVAEQQRAQQATGAQTGMQTSGMMGQSVDVSDIKGKQLVDSSNEKLGKIDEIVRQKDGDQYHAVVSVADEDKKVSIPLNQIEMRGDTLQAPQAASSKEQLAERSEYQEGEYEQVSAGQQIDQSEFAAFESEGGTGQRSPQQGSGMQPGGGMQQQGSPSGTRY
jgi:sporulation protein YlmC with PRC-barrel domain